MILAKSKPPQSLPFHLDYVRQTGHTLLTPARLNAFDRVGVGHSHAEDLVSAATWLHDWGKATNEWQSAIKSDRNTPQHSLTGFLATLWAFGVKNIESIPTDQLAVALAVLGHHGQLSDASFRPEVFANEHLTIPWDVWQELKNDLPIQGATAGNAPVKVPARTVCDRVAHAKSRCRDLPNDSLFRGLYCLLLTLLVQADHAASADTLLSPQSITEPRVAGVLTNFQKNIPAHPSDVLCGVAGCGSGKTAAALLRAAEYSTRFQVDRIVICLPTRFTSNSLLRDMSDANKYAYPKDKVGLVHSEALQVLRRSFGDEEDFPDDPEELASQSVRYETPITISTVDHLLMSLYHGYKFADRAFGNLLSSLVVFDEVHAYDTTTLSAIYEGLQVLKKFQIPTLFLSATLPTSRRQFFEIGNKQTVLEIDNPYQPFTMSKLSCPLTTGSKASLEVSSEVRECLKAARGIKLAVYVNQVERAKALANAACEEMPGIPIYCYHSELAPCDRQSLEQTVIHAFKQDAPVVLIATQAAELSLDISADQMVTELAPADVLVQRGGRLHRRGLFAEEQDDTHRLPKGFRYRLLVAPLDLTTNEDGVCPAALPYDNPKVLQDTWDMAPWDEVFTFDKGLKWCEQVLVDVPQRKHIGLEAASLRDVAFGRKPEENFAGENNQDGVTIRDIEDNYVEVVPECHAKNLPRTLMELSQYFVPLRLRKFHAIDKGLVEERNHQIIIGFGRKARAIDYKLKVIRSNINYRPTGGGFDFLSASGVLAPTVTFDNFG